MSELSILGCGAVTAVGLTAAQTCAAVRAGIKRFSPIEAQILESDEPRVGARVSADPRLRIDEAEWLIALAGRALLECADAAGEEPVLLWLVPEDHRGHPLCAGVGDSELLRRLEQGIQRRFAPTSRVLRSGAAGCVEALGLARELCKAGARRCVIGGADSLLRLADLEALGRASRLIASGQSQGMVPGEGAAFVVVGPDPGARERASGEDGEAGETEPRIGVRGLGLGYERNTVLGHEYSVGEALVGALETARQDADIPEPELDFVAGNFNGERYDAWETAHANARGYPTRRQRLPTMWSVGSTGDVGVAGGTLALIVAATAIAQGYAQGTTGVVQVRSEGELRGVAVLR